MSNAANRAHRRRLRLWMRLNQSIRTWGWSSADHRWHRWWKKDHDLMLAMDPTVRSLVYEEGFPR